MPSKLTIIHGIPGSGKSTLAQRMVDSDPVNTVRVNRDDIRTALFGESYHAGKFDKKDESRVDHVEKELLARHLREGKHVISDNTNLTPMAVSSVARIGIKYGAKIDQLYMDTPVEVSRQRNLARGAAGGREVPDFVMDQMVDKAYSPDGSWKEYIIADDGATSVVERNSIGAQRIAALNEKLATANPLVGKTIVMVDVDGTLAHNAADVDKYFGVPGAKKNYPGFFRSIQNAPVNTGVVDMVNSMRDKDGLNLIVLTGRSDSHAAELVSFIERSGVKASRVIAKREGDFRPSYEYKRDIVLGLVENEGLIPVHAVDDRPQDIKFWEVGLGLSVSRVDYHNPSDPSLVVEGYEYPVPGINTTYGSGFCLRCGSALKDPTKNIGPKCASR